jgi:carboxypeptidase Taq
MGKSLQAFYEELIRRSREEALLRSCAAVLEWDELTYMPPGGVTGRANQLAYLAGLEHDRATDPRLGKLLAELENSSWLGGQGEVAAANVREARRSFDRLTRLPRTLVEEQARLVPLAQQQWSISRQEADFASFRPWLEKIIALKRQEADCLGYADEPYDALLEDHEPGTRTADIVNLFASLREELAGLMRKIGQSRRRPKSAILRRSYAADAQQAFGREVASALGFDFARGRLDRAVHPFCSQIGAGDCRLAIRYSTNNFSDAFFSLLHEVGHGLYDQGLDPAYEGMPVGTITSVGLHESQARLWENLVGRSLSFWKYFFPRARQAFPEALGKVSLADFHVAVNHVGPSANRVQADEVTYNLHILIRFELERTLIKGDLSVADLPGAWNDAYKSTLGIVPANDAEGCLQDGHWSEGLIGYFPTYTLGNLFAAQLFSSACAELGNLDQAFAHGHFTGLLDWLRDKIYRHGSLYSAPELVQRATGAKPDHRPLIQGLQEKYGELFGF